MKTFRQWLQEDALGYGGMHTSQKGHEDQSGLAYLNPVLEPHPKSRRSKKIEILFGRKEDKADKEDDNVAQNRQGR